MSREPQPGPPAPAPRRTHDTRAREQPIWTGTHELLLLADMDDLIASVDRDVDASHRRVHIETYIYKEKKLGRRFARRLGQAVTRGADARLLYDPLGSRQTSTRFFEQMKAHGIDARAYRPLSVVARQGDPFPRDHSRIIVTDAAAYTGGAAWGDEWLPRRLGGRGWYDVCVRVEGPCVEDFRQLFEQRWREADGSAPPADFTTGDKYLDLELIGDTPDQGHIIEDRYRHAIRRAKRRIWLEHAYFFPPRDTLRDLFAAAARGVEVHVVVPTNSDLPIMADAAYGEYEAWMARGITLFEYQATMLHSKLAVIDDHWCSIGSFNMNPASTGYSNEVALFVHHPAFVARVAAQFQADRTLSRRVHPDTPHTHRPTLKRARHWLAATALRLIERT